MRRLAIGFVFAMLVAFQNCSPAEFTTTSGANADSSDEEKFKEIAAACDNGPIQTQSHSVSFPSNLNANSTVCQWKRKSNGDLKLANDFVMARNEEARSIQLPQGATLCGLDFQIQNQTFEYDDMFFLNFNEVVLVSSTSWFQNMPKWQGLDIYNWNQIEEVKWPLNYNSNLWIYCAGASEGQGSCTVPKSETSGNFFLDYDRSLIQKIGIRGGDTHEFKLVVTGDDNPSIDCRHESLNFNVVFSYVTN